MYREEHWSKGHYMDNMVKNECSDCGKTFIIGEEMKKDCPPGYPVCPYCGQSNVEWVTWCTDENSKDMHENGIGCSGLYIDLEGR